MSVTVDDTSVGMLLSPLVDALDARSLEKLIRFRADSKAQQRIDELAEKCNDGTLSDAESQEYESLVHAATVVAILQAEAKKTLETQHA